MDANEAMNQLNSMFSRAGVGPTLDEIMHDQQLEISKELYVEAVKRYGLRPPEGAGQQCWEAAGVIVALLREKANKPEWRGTDVAQLVMELEAMTGFDLGLTYAVPKSHVLTLMKAAFKELGDSYETARIMGLLDVDPRVVSMLAKWRLLNLKRERQQLWDSFHEVRQLCKGLNDQEMADQFNGAIAWFDKMIAADEGVIRQVDLRPLTLAAPLSPGAEAELLSKLRELDTRTVTSLLLQDIDEAIEVTDTPERMPPADFGEES